LRTCFDNIAKLDINTENNDIVAMLSVEQERVPFAKSPRAKGQVEIWLGTVQNAMRESLQKLMKAGVNDYQTANDRKEWIMTHFGQIVATVAQIMWCSQTEIYIQENEKIPGSLQEWLDINLQQLTQLTELV